MSHTSSKTFFLHFIGIFSVTLIVTGVLHGIFGTLKIYNVSEEEFESTQITKVYTAGNAVSLPKNLSQIIKNTQQKNESTPLYIIENKEIIEKALKDMPPEKSKKAKKELKEITDTYNIPSFDPASGGLKEKKEIQPSATETPVRIQILPREELEPVGYKKTILDTVTGKYFRDALWSFPVIVDTDRTSPRGQMKDESVTLTGTMKSLSEVTKVLVHELAHMIDIYKLDDSNGDDISNKFYRIAWEDANVKKADTTMADFLSGYAATNQYEDFAESFTMYVFHNKTFLSRAQENKILMQKYAFFYEHIFGKEFRGSAYEKEPVPKKIWDVTKVALKTDDFSEVFASLKNIRHLFSGV